MFKLNRKKVFNGYTIVLNSIVQCSYKRTGTETRNGAEYHGMASLIADMLSSRLLLLTPVDGHELKHLHTLMVSSDPAEATLVLCGLTAMCRTLP